MSDNPRDFTAEVAELHKQVDQRAVQIGERNAGRLQCGMGCFQCCLDTVSVFEVEAQLIRENCEQVLEGEPHPGGRCAFLDSQGGCRIYSHRPYVCRTQGLPLRWMESDAEGAVVEYRDICPLNDHGQPLQQLEEDFFWTIGEWEERLAEIQQKASGGELRRVRLRSLFQVGGPKDSGR